MKISKKKETFQISLFDRMISIEYKYLKTRFFVEEKLFNKSPHLNHLVKYFLTRQRKKKKKEKKALEQTSLHEN